MDPISKFVVDYLLETTSQLIMPLMLICFAVGVSLRAMLYFVAKSEHWFAMEFYKRAQLHLMNPDAPKVASFHRLLRILLVKTYTDCYETRIKYRRRSLDYIQPLFERMFLIEDGVKRCVEDTLKQTRYLKKDGTPQETRLLEISKRVFENNPFFNRLIGVFSVSLLNDLLTILPSLFIIGGIFGTFLGISKSLPELGHMDLTNMEETKAIMDMFLIKISTSMIKSIIGIAFSVMMSVVNTMFSIEGTYYEGINKFWDGLVSLWHETQTNELDRVDPFAKTDKPGEKAGEKPQTAVKAA